MRTTTISLFFGLAIFFLFPHPANSQAWIKIGGDLDPLGEQNPVQYAKIGVAAEEVPYPYGDAYGVLLISCGDDPPMISAVVYESPILQVERGRARIDDHPVQEIPWARSGSTMFALLASAATLADPQRADLREELRAGTTLTVAADTNVGEIFFRFSLEGFQVQELLCGSG